MRRLMSVLLFAVLTACAQIQSPAEQAMLQAVDPVQRIAIATAYAPELDALRADLQNARVKTINGVAFHIGTLDARPVVVFMTGISMTNAAMNTQLMLSNFDVSAVVVSGVGGSLNPKLSIGDVTVPRRWAQYDEMIYMRPLGEDGPARQTGPTYADYSFAKPDLPAFGFMKPRGVRIANQGDPAPERRFWFAADDMLLETASVAQRTVTLEKCTQDGSAAVKCLEDIPQIVIGGSGLSASAFMDNADVRTYLHEQLGGDVVEMETAAIAAVSHANQVPFIAFRSVSDLAGGGGNSYNEVAIFEDLAAKNAAAFVHGFLSALE